MHGVAYAMQHSYLAVAAWNPLLLLGGIQQKRKKTKGIK